MSDLIDSLERDLLRKLPGFSAGDRVKVHFQVVEGNRRRTQVFEGVVLKRQGSGVRETFTVRKQSFGVGVERTFPLHSPKIERIEVSSRGDVRRAKLYYLRGRIGKAARVRERQYTGEGGVVEVGEPGAFDEQGAQEAAAPEPVEPSPTAGAASEPEGAEGAASEPSLTADAASEPSLTAGAASEPEDEASEPEAAASAEEPAPDEDAESAEKG